MVIGYRCEDKITMKKQDPYLNDVIRNRRSRQYPDSLADLCELKWVEFSVEKFDTYGQKYYRDEEKKNLDGLFKPTIPYVLEAANCAYEKTLVYNNETKFRRLKYWLKDTVFEDYLYKGEERRKWVLNQ